MTMLVPYKIAKILSKFLNIDENAENRPKFLKTNNDYDYIDLTK